MAKSNIAKVVIEHPDKDEIITKLLSNVSVSDIHEWLEAKYVNVNENKFVLSEKVISTFQKDYLDMYSIIRDDVAKTKSNKITAEEELKQEIQGSPTYHKILEQYANNEVDIKIIVKKLVATIETRAAQVFDQIQDDPLNNRGDRILIEWFNTLITVLEKYDTILNGNPDQINIQNNINIQIVDEHINVVYNIIKEILAKLDYDTSLLFIDMFNEEMKKLEPLKEKVIIPQQERIKEAKILNEVIAGKLEK
jgi:hypothetical protein